MEFESERVARGLDGGGDEDDNTICHRRRRVSKTREGLGVESTRILLSRQEGVQEVGLSDT